MSAARHATDPSRDLSDDSPSDWISPPLDLAAPPAVAVHAVFRGVTTHARILTFPGHDRARPRNQFTIGWQSGVDAPVAERFVPWATHPLVLAAGSDYVVNTTPQMTGEVRDGGQVYSLAAYIERRGRTFKLPESGDATLDCGSSRFVIARTAAPKAIPAPRWRWSWQQHGYTLAAGIGLALMLFTVAFIPGDPKSLALDLFERDGRRVAFTIKPPVEAALPPELTNADGSNGGAGAAAAGPSGKMGDKRASRSDGRFSIKRRASETEVRLSKQQAADAAREAGILGVFKRVDSSAVSAVFGAEKALGDSAEDVLGHLRGDAVASAYDVGGLGTYGTGDRGGGTGEGILGAAPSLNVIGPGSGPGKGPSYVRLVGTLGPRARPRLPDVIPALAQVRGSLDKSIVRRIVRLHLNEVKFCYEKELTHKPSLGGRVVVHFVISPNGTVLTSALQSSTLGSAVVEGCTVQAVRRWQFPAPDGGGLVMVSYPFVLSPAGG